MRLAVHACRRYKQEACILIITPEHSKQVGNPMLENIPIARFTAVIGGKNVDHKIETCIEVPQVFGTGNISSYVADFAIIIRRMPSQTHDFMTVPGQQMSDTRTNISTPCYQYPGHDESESG